MARKGRNRPKKLGNSKSEASVKDAHVGKVERASNTRISSISLEVEPDADRLILESLEKFDKEGWRAGDKIDQEPKLSLEQRAKAVQRRDAHAVGRTLDLHRLTIEEAKLLVDRELGSLVASLRAGEKVKVRIITGKGRHSGSGGAVLPREIHQYVRRTFPRFISRMDESPADLVIGELPLRGHFDVILVGR